jgi:outer membrane protein OmpA-like peptidoglycan-associated protein
MASWQKRRLMTMEISRRLALPVVWVLTGCLFFSTGAFGQDDEGQKKACVKATQLYNQACDLQDSAAQERLYREALAAGCRQKHILARIYNNLGDSLEKQGRHEQAKGWYRLAIEADPNLGTAYQGLGDLYARENNHRKAKELHEKGFLLASYRSTEEIATSLSPKRAIGAVPRLDLYFGFDQAFLGNEAQRQLQALAHALNSTELRNYHFSLEGHTCSDGSDAYNQALSERRALTVVQWLTTEGIDPNRLTAQGHGETRPVRDNRKEDGKRFNRRVEIRTIGLMPDRLRSSSSVYRRAVDLLSQGKKHLAREQYQEALTSFREALALFRKENNAEGVQAALADLDLTYRYLGEWDKANACREEMEKREPRTGKVP